MKLHEICPILNTAGWRRIPLAQLAEIRQREFHTDEVWIKWKQELDLCMSYRKSIKGKPTEEQLFYLQENTSTIKHLRGLLFGR